MSQYPMVTRIYRKTLELYRRRQEQIALRRCHLFWILVNGCPQPVQPITL